ncbi:MAG: rod shape-determining protein RodA [Chloracidobacterium sp. CP2_5A]|nr:MAG: rod shape-determining protein RodA [Chloracidobacterium sp. CP2_5A]
MQERPWRDFDWTLLVALTLLCVASIVALYSTNAAPGGATEWHQKFWFKQLAWCGIGYIAFFWVARLSFQRVFDAAPYVYAATILLLIAVLFIGVKINGQRCWIRLGPLGTLQPSEFAKLGTILLAARILRPIGAEGVTWRQLALVAAAVLLPVALILQQPDAGTALTFFPPMATMIFLSGISLRWVTVSAVAGLVLGPVLFAFVLEPRLKQYQRDRINVTWNAIFYPERLQDRQTREGFGYQTLQSMIAVGSGGIVGKGFRGGTQSQGGFVPEHHSDFIASVVAEEFGLVGSLGVLALLLFIILHSANVAGRSRERFSMLVLAGYMALLAFHVIINFGMVIGLVPIMGIPLPLLSAGGSSLLMTFASLGLVANAHGKRFSN